VIAIIGAIGVMAAASGPGMLRANAASAGGALNEPIAGTWQLESLYEEDAGGEEIEQFGQAPRGLFMADRQGNFSFQVMSSEGRRYAALSRSPAGTALSPGILDAMTYYGTYTFSEPGRVLTLHVAQCLFRSCDRTERIVDVKIRADTMEFTSAVVATPTGAAYSHMVWKRR